MFASRKAADEKMKQNDPIASDILIGNGVDINDLPFDKEATILKLKGMDSDWNIKICNKDLHLLDSKEIDAIFENIDYDKYLTLLRDAFEKNWKNESPEIEPDDKEQNDSVNDLFSDLPEDKTPMQTDIPDLPETANPLPDEYTLDSTNETTDPPPMPVLYPIRKRTLTQEDIIEGEKQLNLGGVRLGEEHSVLAKLLKKVFDTDIQ